jgi:hypothetical protein
MAYLNWLWVFFCNVMSDNVGVMKCHQFDMGEVNKSRHFNRTCWARRGTCWCLGLWLSRKTWKEIYMHMLFWNITWIDCGFFSFVKPLNIMQSLHKIRRIYTTKTNMSQFEPRISSYLIYDPLWHRPFVGTVILFLFIHVIANANSDNCHARRKQICHQ